MSIFIFHGEGTAASRKALHEAVSRDRAAGHEIRTIEGDKLLARDLESSLATESLFSQETLVIENLLSRLRSKEKDACLTILGSYKGTKNILLWDKKEITKPNLTKLSQAKISLSKAPTSLFAFLDSVEPGNSKIALSLLHESISSSEDIIVFTMLARQVSYLIIIKSASTPKFAPWQIGKLKTQAAKWEAKPLEHFLSELLKIDFAVKTGATKLSYADHLDLLLSDLLR